MILHSCLDPSFIHLTHFIKQNVDLTCVTTLSRVRHWRGKTQGRSQLRLGCLSFATLHQTQPVNAGTSRLDEGAGQRHPRNHPKEPPTLWETCVCPTLQGHLLVHEAVLEGGLPPLNSKDLTSGSAAHQLCDLGKGFPTSAAGGSWDPVDQPQLLPARARSLLSCPLEGTNTPNQTYPALRSPGPVPWAAGIAGGDSQTSQECS